MKKRKLICLSTLFLLLGVTGCFDNEVKPVEEGGYVGTKDGHYKIDTKGNKIGDTEPHVLVDSDGDSTHKPVAATCDISGKACKQCEICKKIVDIEIPALGHDFVSSTDPNKAATCTRAGLLECSRCGKTKESGEPLGHRWATTGEALTEGATDAAVKKYSCTACSAASYEIDVKTGNFTLTSGSAWKNDPSTGVCKLNKDDQSYSFTFSLPKTFKGKMYQRAYMDSYSANKDKKIYFETDGVSNTKVTVNNKVIDMSPLSSKTFTDYFGEELDGSNSTVKEVLIGDVDLATSNTVTFERVKTLNMLVSAFLFVED